MKITQVQSHEWIDDKPLPTWVRKRYFHVDDGYESGALLCFSATHSHNDGITLRIMVRREGMPWGDVGAINKSILPDYIEFLKEQMT